MHSTLFRINGKFWGLSGETEVSLWLGFGVTTIIRPDRETGYIYRKCKVKLCVGFLFTGSLQPEIVDNTAKDEK